MKRRTFIKSIAGGILALKFSFVFDWPKEEAATVTIKRDGKRWVSYVTFEQTPNGDWLEARPKFKTVTTEEFAAIHQLGRFG